MGAPRDTFTPPPQPFWGMTFSEPTELDDGKKELTAGSMLPESSEEVDLSHTSAPEGLSSALLQGTVTEVAAPGPE